MKLHLQNAVGTQLITAYGADYVAVNGVRHEHSLIVLPERSSRIGKRWNRSC